MEDTRGKRTGEGVKKVPLDPRLRRMIDVLSSDTFKRELEEDPPTALSRLTKESPPGPSRAMDLCELLVLVCRRGLTDDRFRKKLLSDPNDAICKALGLDRKVDGVTFHVHENRRGEVHLVLPLSPDSLPEKMRRMIYDFEKILGIESIAVPDNFTGE
jgi:hypothetical protein